MNQRRLEASNSDARGSLPTIGAVYMFVTLRPQFVTT